MISVLVVGKEGDELAELEGQDPSIEVLAAHGAEDALEKLGRNRRIDAILLLGEDARTSLVQSIEEDSPAHPPIFVPGGLEGPTPGAIPLSARDPRELLNLLKAKLEG
jgi:hypothetical protein